MPRWSVVWIRLALVSMLAGFALGAVMLSWPAAKSQTAIAVHIELLMQGWFVPLAFGVASWMLPRLPTGPRHGVAASAWASLSLHTGGVVLAVVAHVLGAAAVLAVARALQLAGAGVFAWYIAPRLGIAGRG